jgi:hypothetical protein
VKYLKNVVTEMEENTRKRKKKYEETEAREE